ncbi:cytochrome P450 4V2-like [Macrosteles quadrilineatus]|uniref:cytochrome P450 4V2-like n=1 Tax=Macrosteles quadrilineatus TaxID=74068 RepID=UPI0023E309E6|nr:cytochrome P450 4V2-like [Macrosteles quadrilineatus]
MLGVLVSVVTSVLAYVLLLLLVVWCWFQWTKWDFLQVARRMPSTVKVFPIIGSLHLMLGGNEGFTRSAIINMSKAAVSTGLYNVCVWLGPLPVLLFHKVEDVQKILTTSAAFEKASELDYFKYAAGNGLLTAPGHIWKITRRHISPLFHARNVEQMMSVFNSNSKEMVSHIEEHLSGESLDVLHPSMSVSLKTVCQLIFGTELDFDTRSKEFQGLIKVVEKIPDYFSQRMIKPWLRVDPIFEFLYRKELKEMDKLWTQFTEAPLKVANTNHANKNKSTENENEESEHEGPLNLIDVYRELQKKYPQFTESDLKGEMVTLYCTGTDTISLTVSSCLMVLGKLQEIQERVYEEITEVVGQDDDVTTDHISKMQYLDQVYKETLRWAIIVPYVSRRTTEDLKLSTCTVPAGNSVVACLVGPHMDPNIYPDPDKFDPEHFSPENPASRNKHAFIPFSTGSRMCIGKTYTENLVKTMLVQVLRKLKVSTDLDIYNLKKKYVVTLVSSEGYPIKFSQRT